MENTNSAIMKTYLHPNSHIECFYSYDFKFPTSPVSYFQCRVEAQIQRARKSSIHYPYYTIHLILWLPSPPVPQFSTEGRINATNEYLATIKIYFSIPISNIIFPLFQFGAPSPSPKFLAGVIRLHVKDEFSKPITLTFDIRILHFISFCPLLLPWYHNFQLRVKLMPKKLIQRS